MDEIGKTRLLEAVDIVRAKIETRPEEVTLEDLLLSAPEYKELRGEIDKTQYVSYDTLLAILEKDGELAQSTKNKFEAAYIYAKNHHDGQIRKKEGVPFFYHVERIMLMMAMFGIKPGNEDLMPILALHDVFDNPKSLTLSPKKTKPAAEVEKELRVMFGDNVTDHVMAMSDSKKAEFPILKRDVKFEQIMTMLGQEGTYHWVAHVLDRIDNLRDADTAYSLPTRRMKLEETWSIYLPIAKGLSPVLGHLMETQVKAFSHEYNPSLFIPKRLMKGGLPRKIRAIENSLHEPPYVEAENKIIEKGDTANGRIILEGTYLMESLENLISGTRKRAKDLTAKKTINRMDEANGLRAISYIAELWGDRKANIDARKRLTLRFPFEKMKPARGYLCDELFPIIEYGTLPNALEGTGGRILNDSSGVYKLQDGTLVYTLDMELTETQPEIQKRVIEAVESKVYENKGYRLFYEIVNLNAGGVDPAIPSDMKADAHKFMEQIDNSLHQMNAVYYIPEAGAATDFSDNVRFLHIKFNLVNKGNDLIAALYGIKRESASKVV